LGFDELCGPARQWSRSDAGEGREAVAEQVSVTFGSLLRQLRDEAFLTQEELAGAAGLSPRSVSDLERGVSRTARVESARLLADALKLAGETRTMFLAAARGRAEPAAVLAASRGRAPGGFAAATRTLPRTIASFVGRAAELAELERAVTEGAVGGWVVGIHSIGGMAGIGKTTFAVHAAHRLAGWFPDGQFFLPLHAHTAGQRPVEPADALASLLMTAGVPAHHIPAGAEARSAVWRDYLAGKQVLLVLDDAAGHEQVRPLLPGTPGSFVLITSRGRLTALEEAAEISLDTLSPAESAALLARLSGRPGLASGDGAAGDITRMCGYLPLAIGMLARQLGQHRSWDPGDLAVRLTVARDRLSLMQAENLSVAAAFDLSYADLTPGQQRLFRRLGLIPGPTVDAYAAAALSGDSLEATWRNLDGLFSQHLLSEPVPGRYLLHDLLREHARALADAGDSADGGAAERLLDYYAYAAAMAGKHIATRTALEGRTPPGRPPGYVPDLTTVGQAAEWLETERPNLHAAVDQAIACGMPLHAVAIAGAIGGFLRGHGYFEQAAGLHQTALAAARQASDLRGQASAYDELGFMAWLGGDSKSAAASFRQAVALFRELGDQVGEANAINHVALVQWTTGDYRGATASNQQALTLAQSAGDPLTEAIISRDLGIGEKQMGDYRAAEASLTKALERLRAIGDRPGQGYALDHLSDVYLRTGNYPAAAASATEALQIACDLHDRPGQAWALNRLGKAQQETGEFAAAASHQQALEWLREIGQPYGEADVLNSLGELSTRTSATGRARDYHAQALAIARDVELPEEEARAYEGIGRSHLRDGDGADAIQNLRQALQIYQRIGAAAAGGTQAALRSAGQG
jgi:tetratricopeptide (TPR) repeat protein/transcriptional regulator with XRE-family HTH domain